MQERAGKFGEAIDAIENFLRAAIPLTHWVVDGLTKNLVSDLAGEKWPEFSQPISSIELARESIMGIVTACEENEIPKTASSQTRLPKNERALTQRPGLFRSVLGCESEVSRR